MRGRGSASVGVGIWLIVRPRSLAASTNGTVTEEPACDGGSGGKTCVVKYAYTRPSGRVDGRDRPLAVSPANPSPAPAN